MNRALRSAIPATVVLFGACVTVAPGVTSDDPALQARAAVTELMREDYAAARPKLLELISRCESGSYGRSAVLLLAAAELDTGNGSGSPRTAAHLARSYLQLPSAPAEEMLLARALYRMAANLGGLEPVDASTAPPNPLVASRFEGCGAPFRLTSVPLPSVPEVTLAEQLRSLQAQVHARSDSLQAIQSRSAGSRARVEELEAELRRITELLTSGAERQSSMDRP